VAFPAVQGTGVVSSTNTAGTTHTVDLPGSIQAGELLLIFFDKGSLMINNWHKFNLLTDYNCYWDTRSSDIKFGDKSFSDWQKSGKDQHSLITDPLFVDPSAFDFRFKKLSVAKKIKFTPFDYSEAGVYGSEEWKKLALMETGLAEKFDNIFESMEKGVKGK